MFEPCPACGFAVDTPNHIHGCETARSSSTVPDPTATTVTIPEDVYDALLRLAAVHKRQFCDCENCTPEKAFPYDACGCGHDWTTCNEDVYVVDAYVPNWRDQP